MGLRKTWRLWQYYRLKKQSVTADLTVAWVPNVRRKDIGYYRFQTVVTGNRTVVVTLVAAQRMQQKFAVNAQLDIHYEEGKKPIRQCTFSEFCTLYGDWILDVALDPNWMR